MLAARASRREVSADFKAPWFQTQPYGVIVCSRKYMTFATGNDNGSLITGITMAAGRGSLVPTTVAPDIQYFRNFNGKGLGYLDFVSSGVQYLGVNQWAAAVSGIAKPFTLFFAGRNPAGGMPNLGSRLVSFGRASSATPLIDLFGNAVGTTSFQLARRNDANNLVQSPTYDPGSNPFVFYGAYDGANIYTALNYSAVTVTPANAGALTVDLCTVGAFARGGPNLPWPGDFAFCYFDTIARLGSEADSIRAYCARAMGI